MKTGKKELVSVYLPIQLKALMEKICKKKKRSMSYFIRELIADNLTKELKHVRK